MKPIMTVVGPMDATKLGHIQPHEHLYVADTPAAREHPELRIDDEARSADELRSYRALGGGAVVDCQPGGAGRDLFALRRISRASGVPIVAVTGYHMPAFYPPEHWRFSDGMEALRDRFLMELAQGVRETPDSEPVFPGAVKAAIGGEGPAGRFETCLRAAARAAAGAGVPLILHTERGAGAVEAVALCAEEGLDPSRVAVCHADRQASDYSVHEAIARTGAYLEYDTVARPKYHDEPSEIALIRHMLSRGYADRLLLSLDTTAARLQSYGGAPGLGYILRDFLPMLSRAGVSPSEIETMTRANPRRLFQ